MPFIKETMQAEAEAQLKTVCLSRLHRELMARLISYPPKLISLIRLTFNQPIAQCVEVLICNTVLTVPVASQLGLCKQEV